MSGGKSGAGELFKRHESSVLRDATIDPRPRHWVRVIDSETQGPRFRLVLWHLFNVQA